MPLKKILFLALACSLLLAACSKESRHIFVTSELNTVGTRHIVAYNNELVPSKIIYETFMGSGTRDTTGIDSLTTLHIDSIVYDYPNRQAKLVRIVTNGEPTKRNFRKYYFNSDNLLVRMTRFSNSGEFTTDSVYYDYTRRRAHFLDLINRISYVLEYDVSNNILSCIQAKTSDGTPLNSEYYYYDQASNPFLAHFPEDDLLFGCFNINNVGLFWNNGVRPAFSSRNNIQSMKRIRSGEETNELFEYQYHEGVPVVQYGSDGVVYYRYLKPAVAVD